MLYRESEYKRVFQDADKDKDGYISYVDLKKLVLDIDYMFPEGLIRKAFDEAKIRIPPADKMDLPEFMEAMGRLNFYRVSGAATRGQPILFSELQGSFAHYLRTPRFARYLYEAFFHETDTNQDGYITYEEFQTQSRKYKLEYLDRTILLEFKKHNTSGDGYMNLVEFMIAMGFPPLGNVIQKPKPAPPPVKVEPPKPKGPKFQLGASLLRQIFMSMDQDGDGVLNRDEVKKVFKQLGQEMTDAEVRQMMSVHDKRGDGTLTFDEFVNFAMPATPNSAY